MTFLKLEQALNKLSTGSVFGEFDNYAGIFKTILESRISAPQKAKKLADLINEVTQKRNTAEKKMLTPKEYASLVGKDEKTIRRWCREGKLQNVKVIGSPKSKGARYLILI